MIGKGLQDFLKYLKEKILMSVEKMGNITSCDLLPSFKEDNKTQ
jgi:hypothetical protein